MSYALVNMILLDGTLDMVPQEGCAVVVDGQGCFDSIVPVEELDGNMERIDLDGGYLMPGLINMHTHIILAGKAPKNDKATDYRGLVQSLKRIGLVKWYFLRSEAKNVKNQLLSGVTTLRSVGGIDDWDGIIKDRINSGQIVGPRILLANTAISVPGGHFAGSLATEATTPEEAAAHVQMVAKTNPDLIKLMITGGVMDATESGEPGALRMAPDLAKAAVEQAHSLGYPVAAHVESTEGVRVALEAGVDTIEHGAQPTDEIMALFKEKGSADICTISPALPYVLMPLEIAKCGQTARDNGTIVMDGIIECAKRCLQEGVPVGLGTDSSCPFITHYDMWRELVYFVKFCGVTPAFALHTATLVNAQILGLDHEIGSIEPGKKADFIVSYNNPLTNLATLRKLKMVAKDGIIIHEPRPVKDPKVDSALDSISLT